MTEALKLTLHAAFERDQSLVTLGEDVGMEGGVFRITEGMHERFGADRVIDTPLCETGIMGTAVGMAMAGLRPVAEIEFAGFVYPAFDQLIGHVARIRWRYRGHLTAPVVARLPVGTNLDNHEFHTDSPESLFTHAPGLVVVYPVEPLRRQGPDGVGAGQRRPGGVPGAHLAVPRPQAGCARRALPDPVRTGPRAPRRHRRDGRVVGPAGRARP